MYKFCSLKEGAHIGESWERKNIMHGLVLVSSLSITIKEYACCCNSQTLNSEF